MLIQVNKNKALLFSTEEENIKIEKVFFLGNKVLDNYCIVISGNLNNNDKTINWEIIKNYKMANKIKNALISVSDKGALNLLEVLKKNNVNIISSGGTYKSIKKLGFKCKEISEFTQTKEMLDGRVKTLHPKIHSGILFNRLKKKHRKEMLQNKFDPIDLDCS